MTHDIAIARNIKLDETQSGILMAHLVRWVTSNLDNPAAELETISQDIGVPINTPELINKAMDVAIAGNRSHYISELLPYFNERTEWVETAMSQGSAAVLAWMIDHPEFRPSVIDNLDWYARQLAREASMINNPPDTYSTIPHEDLKAMGYALARLPGFVDILMTENAFSENGVGSAILQEVAFEHGTRNPGINSDGESKGLRL